MWQIGIAFLIGHCVVHLLPVLPAPAAWMLMLPLLMMAFLRRLPIVAALMAGLCWAAVNANLRLADDLPVALEGSDVVVRGYIASLVQSGDADPQFLFDVREAPVGVPRRIRLSSYQSTLPLRPAELWQLTVRLKRRNGFANPGGFDYEAYLFREGIGASGYVRDAQRLSGPSWRYPVLRARASIADAMTRAVGNHRMLGVLQGLAIGETQAMRADQWRVFAATGTTHLMAISGLHISMVAALIAWLTGRIVRLHAAQARGWSAVRIGAVGGLCAGIAYSLLAGFSVPTQRTLVMLTVYFVARWSRRELNVGQALGLALILVLLMDPFAPLAAGAWLSFGAVTVILLAVAGRIVKENTVRSFGRVQVAVTIGLLPVVLSIFGNLSLVSPLANAMAIPLFTALIVPLVLLGALTCWIYVPLGEWLLRSAAYVLDLSWPALEWLARQPSAVWYFPHVPLVPFAALVIGVLLLLLPGIWPTRITGLLLCLPAMIYRPEAPAFGAFALQLLDVGQGLAVVIQTQHHALLYDTGPAFRTGRDTGELVILPYLRWRGIRALDTLMVSHGDLDHAGGMRSVLAAMPVHTVKVGPSVHPAPPGASHCRSGQRWTWDGVQFEVLYPPGAGLGDSHDAKRSDNDTSCVLRISTQAGSALLSGDIEALSEARLVREGLPPTDVVVVPHHGSRSSSSVAFVGAVDARLALFSCGYRNRWGFPKPDVQLRWQYQGAQTASTIDSGAISVLVGMGEPLQITEHRHAHPRYWQRTAPARDEVHNQAAP